MMNKKPKLPYIVSSRKTIFNCIVRDLILVFICVILLLLFPELKSSYSFNARRLRIILTGSIVLSVVDLFWLPFVNHEQQIFVDYEGIKFKDDKYILHTCRWDNIKEMSFVPLSTYRKRKRGDPSYVIRIEPYHGKEMFLEYSITILNLYKFRRIVREASGRDDILESKGPLWTKTF